MYTGTRILIFTPIMKSRSLHLYLYPCSCTYLLEIYVVNNILKSHSLNL